MAWFILFVAGIFEIAWAVGLKYSEGLSKLWPSVITIVCLVISMAMLAFAVRSLPVGTAYAVWTGIGAVGTVILGMVLFNEPKDLVRIFFIGMILAGIIGLKFFTK